eukprot:5185120-Pleurochrysis_carterae.AAC.1
MNGLEAGVVVNQDKQILESCVLRAHEGTRDVGMNETAGVRRFIQRRVVRVSGCVSFGACRTPFEMAMD